MEEIVFKAKKGKHYFKKTSFYAFLDDDTDIKTR